MGNTGGDGGYYPPPESAGGWRTIRDAEDSERLAGVNLGRLEAARAWNVAHGVPSSVVIIRRGWLVAEWYENGSRPDTTFNIYSCSKSFTGTAYGILFDDVRRGHPRGAAAVDLDTLAYAHIPEGYPLTDPRKETITLRHLLSMSSGIPGESIGIFGLPTAPGVDPFEAALGHAPFTNKGTGEEMWVRELAAEAGDRWDYADPALIHLSLAFAHIAGQELAEFMRERVFAPLGLESATWDDIGIDDGPIGRHTCAISRVNISAREAARFGYLMARGGAWEGQSLVAPWWTELATRSSQQHNPGYGLTWWVNTGGALWDGVPHDAFSAMGFNTNLCCVIPSLDLVVVRVGIGPEDIAEVIAGPFLAAIAAAVIDA